MSAFTSTGAPNAATATVGVDLSSYPPTLDLAVLQIMSLGRPIPVTGWHDHGKWAYVSEDDLLRTYQEDMARAGLFPIYGEPKISHREVGDSARGNPKWVLQVVWPITLAHVSQQRLVYFSAGEALDLGDGKALSKALTDARKTFLRSIFLGSAEPAALEEPSEEEPPKKGKTKPKPEPKPKPVPEPKVNALPTWTPEEEDGFARKVSGMGRNPMLAGELAERTSKLKRHPSVMGWKDVGVFLEWLATPAGTAAYNKLAHDRGMPLAPDPRQAELGLAAPRQGAQVPGGSA